MRSERDGQLPLDLRVPVPLDRAHFEVGEANRLALAWIERWPGWPARGVVLAGPSGAGKTHLVAIWQARSGAVVIDGAALTLDAVAGPLAARRPIAIDDAERAAEVLLFHLFNAAGELGVTLLLAAAEPPARWGTSLADLRSRLATLPLATIGQPDDALLRSLLRRLLDDQGVRIGDEVLDYLMPRVERSFPAIHRLARALDQASLAHGRLLTVPLARAVLSAPSPPLGVERAGVRRGDDGSLRKNPPHPTLSPLKGGEG